MTVPLIPAVVAAIRKEALHVVALDLRAADGTPLPAFQPGAHIDLHLTEGLVRSYSLINEWDGKQYTVAVLSDKNSRGGSRYVHDKLIPGTQLQISPPRNHFALDENASRTVLVAGGIGVTPILSMRNRLRVRDLPMSMLYCARSREEAAFHDDLAGSPGVSIHLDVEQGKPPDLLNYLKNESPDSDFYCCGPAAMISAFENACETLGFKKVHVERFAAGGPVEATQPGEYEVTLARTGKTIQVTPALSLLETLLKAGVAVDSACREGICGTCETRVLAGVPDHRDSVLSADERSSNTTMLICVSGCKGKSLVLDL